MADCSPRDHGHVRWRGCGVCVCAHHAPALVVWRVSAFARCAPLAACARLNGKFSTVQPWTEKSVAKFTGGGRGFDIVYETGATLDRSFHAVHREASARLPPPAAPHSAPG